MTVQKQYYFYIGIFTISASILAMQILQSRIFSVTTWYHLSFMVISIAMFGLTLGALNVHRGNEKDQRDNYAFYASRACLNCSLFTVIALLTQLYVPIISEDVFKTIFFMPFVSFIISLPYYYAGVAISLSLTRAPYKIPIVYGIDLIGAAVGCVLVILLMENIDTPSCLIFVAALIALSSLMYLRSSPIVDGTHTHRQKAIIYIFIGIIALALFNTSLPKPFFYPQWSKTGALSWEWVEFNKWNSISLITVTPEFKDATPYLWGPSSELEPSHKVSYKQLIIDGDASSPLTSLKPEELQSHSYLEYDVTNLAYNLPHLSKAVIIGVGGGRDILSAKYFGIDHVVGLDVNETQIFLLNEHPVYSQYTNINKLKGVTLLNSEARSWFRQNTQKYDLVQMSLIDTWAATGAGAFALSENGLYTTNAWGLILDDLSEQGFFTVSRWYKEGASNETGRLLSLAVATVLQSNISEPQQHIYLATSGKIATLILSKSGFTAEQLDILNKTTLEKNYNVLAAPDKDPDEPALIKILQSPSLKSLYENTNQVEFYDMTPSTDMRPFFFNQVKFSNPIKIASLAFSDDYGAYLGQAKATFNLFLIIIFSIIMVLGVIIIPLKKKVKDYNRPQLVSGSIYFLLIGLGFMLIEISLLQALGVFLGHPIYGLSVVLFSLILSTGLGSLLSDRLSLTSLKRQVIWSILTCLYVLIIGFHLEDIFLFFSELKLVHRCLVSMILIFPCGILLGYGFPSGMGLIEKFDTKATPWFWGINGAAGVMGSAIAIALNIKFGIDLALIFGGLCYLFLSAIFYSFKKAEIRSPS